MTDPMPGAQPCAPPDARVHALDSVRALAMLAGVLFHAALAYSPLAQPFWPTADRQSHWSIDAAIWLPHLVRMPLFFVVSGFFTAWLLTHRGMAGLMRQRVRRILVPLLVALPLLHVSMLAATRWAARTVEHRSNVLELVRQWMAMTEPPPAPPSFGHLWFLYYLMIFTVLVWIGRTLELGALFDRIAALRARTFALALPLALLPGFALVPAPHPAPEGLLPQFWAIAVYGPFFALGMALHGRLDWLRPLDAWLLPGALVCLAAYVALLRCIALDLQALAAVLQACIAAWGTLACLVAALRWLNRPSAAMRFFAARAYWTYLLHLPVLLVVQYALMDAATGWPWKLAISIAATLAACLSSYEVLVRRTPLRRWVG